ncbi:integrating conjugative element membrane protein (TIGR03747 family) [Rheinheimera pacifica]|nr:TIGR03747 family integrating conjugative element membrane protein [Rheinheimera pacifica]MCS4309143.1 integrating conjugative element membrane protein (TIGR03747 family) [Rheinheimera pacifica]
MALLFEFNLQGLPLNQYSLSYFHRDDRVSELFWPEQGWRHAQGMLQYELSHRSVIVQESGRTAHQLVETGYYEWVFVKTGLLGQISSSAERARAPSRNASRGFRYYLSQAYIRAENLLSLLLFLLAAFVSLVDGLVRRDIRKFGVGRESGFLYHRAKASLLPLAVLPWVIDLSMPISLHPLLLLLPRMVLLGQAVNLTAGSFKKYL